MYSTDGSIFKMSPDCCLIKVATAVKVHNSFCAKCSALPPLTAYILNIRVPIVVSLIISNILNVDTTDNSVEGDS
jgi:hypothetical protein